MIRSVQLDEIFSGYGKINFPGSITDYTKKIINLLIH